MASADRSTLFINATILDGSEHMEPQPDMAVAVERGVITWMGPSAVAQAPAGAEVIDLGGAYSRAIRICPNMNSFIPDTITHRIAAKVCFTRFCRTQRQIGNSLQLLHF